MRPVLVAVYTLSLCHGVIAIFSVCIVIVSAMSADIWMAHKVSPIWSGAFVSIMSSRLYFKLSLDIEKYLL